MKLQTGQKIKLCINIKAEYEIDDLTEMSDIMENLETALDSLRSLGSAEAELDAISIVKDKKS